MARKEQIRQASIEYTLKNRPICIGGDSFAEMADELNRNSSFEEGAKWADKTMIEKACEWLEQFQEDYDVYDAWNGDYVSFKSLIIDFRNAMEE